MLNRPGKKSKRFYRMRRFGKSIKSFCRIGWLRKTRIGISFVQPLIASRFWTKRNFPKSAPPTSNVIFAKIRIATSVCKKRTGRKVARKSWIRGLTRGLAKTTSIAATTFQKFTGCSNMRCAVCNHQWCWTCGMDLRSDFHNKYFE